MKKILTILTLVVCSISLAFAGGDKENSNEKTIRFCLTVTGGRLGDQANNDAVWKGIKEFADENGYEAKAIELDEVADVDRTVREMYAAGFNCFCFLSSDAADQMDDLCPDFPDAKFIMWNGTNKNGYPNLTNVIGDVASGAFLTAICGCLMNETINGQRLVGYIGGVRNPNLERVRYGMQAGAKMIGGECIATYVGSFTDATKAKEITQQMYSNGVEVIQAWAGGANKGIFEAAETAGEGHLSMGGATGQFHMSSTIYASLASKTDEIFKLLCGKVVDETIEGGTFVVSVKNGMIDCLFAPDERASIVPESVKAEIEKYRKMIISGELIVPETAEEYNQFIEKYNL